MAIPGTVTLTGIIAPTSPIDTYPVTDAKYGLDGLRNVTTTIERNAIPAARRKQGMIVGVNAMGTSTTDYWTLLPPPWSNTDSDWVTSFGGGVSQYTSLFNVTASTPDNYIGISSPVVTGYSTDAIYTIVFTDTNVSTGTTINIDSNGQVDLYVPTELGLEGPVPSGFTTGVTYFMVYNGGSMMVYDTDPTGNPFFYTSPVPVPTTIGGVLAGMTFSGASLQYMFDTLLYPYLNPSFSAFTMAGQPTSLEIGATIAGGSRTFGWNTTYPGNIIPNTIKIVNANTNIIISTPPSGMPNDSTEAIVIPSVTRTTAGSQTWTAYATTKKNVNISRKFIVSWYNRVYYGNSSLTSLTASDITGLTGTNLASSSLTTRAYSAGNYKYLCIPVALNNPTLFRDASTNLSIAMAGPSDGYPTLISGYYVQQVNVVNAYGVTITYDVYRTKNILGGVINIISS